MFWKILGAAVALTALIVIDQKISEGRLLE